MANDLETYRTEEEVDMHRKNDPVVVLEKLLLARGVDDVEISEIEGSVDREVHEAVEFAKNSPWPERFEAYTDVYAE